MSDDPNTGDPLEAYALAVGRLCNEWAKLEVTVCHFAAGLMRIPPHSSSISMMRCYDFRDHLAAIKVGVVGGAWSRDWVELVIAAVDYIDNQLRVRRNRFVHDQWLATGEPAEISHFSPIPKVVRPQAHMDRIVVPTQREVRALSEITDTTEEIAEHKSYLAYLSIEFIRAEKGQSIELPLEQPRRRFLRPQPETPRPEGKPPRAPKRPRGSSRE